MLFGIFRFKREAYIKRLVLASSLSKEVDRVLSEQCHDFLFDETEEIPIQDFYPGCPNSSDFISRIEFDDPVGMASAIKAPLDIGVCNPDNDLKNLIGVFGQVDDKSRRIAIQLIENRRILLPKSGWVIFKKVLEGDVKDAVKIVKSPVSAGAFIRSDELGIRLDDKLVAVYDGEYLYFKSFYQANRIFDLGSYLSEATDETVRKFLSLDCIDDGNNPQAIIENLSGFQRRRVARMMALGFVEKYSATEIANRAKRAKKKIPIELSPRGKIKIPEDGEARSMLFQFLANGIMSSYLDDESDYTVDSMRPLNNC